MYFYNKSTKTTTREKQKVQKETVNTRKKVQGEQYTIIN